MKFESSGSFMKYISLLSMVSVIGLTSPNAYSFTLAETLKAAKEYNFEIKIAEDKLKQSESDTRSAFSRFLPQVSSKIGATKNKFSALAYEKGGLSDATTSSSIMQVRQSFFNGGKDVYALQSAKHLVSSGKAQYSATVNYIFIRTIDAYEDLRTKREVLKLNENNIKVHQELLELNQTRFDAGEITATDISQTKAQLANAIANKESAYSDVIGSENTFKMIVGRDAPQDLEKIKLNTAMLPKDLGEFLNVTKAKNPSLIAAKHQTEASVKRVNAAYAEMLPKIDGSVTLSYLEQKNKNLTTSGTAYTLEASMPIFEGGASYANIKKSREARDEAKHYMLKTNDELQAKAIIAWNNYVIYTSIIESRKQAIDAAEKSLAGVREESKMGTRTTMDVLESQQRLLSEQLAYRKAIQNQVVAFYNIFNVMGNLDTIEYS